jgi:uncharacterized protein (TIGR02300 family)
MAKTKAKSKAPVKKSKAPAKGKKPDKKPVKEIKSAKPAKGAKSTKAAVKATVSKAAEKISQKSKAAEKAPPPKIPVKQAPIKPVMGMRPEWGTKRICPSCTARFYDMRKSPIHCPKCGTFIDPDAATKSKRGRPAMSEADKLKAKAAKKAIIDVEDIPAIEPDADEEIVIDEEVVEEEVIEDAGELGEEAEAIEVIDEE